LQEFANPTLLLTVLAWDDPSQHLFKNLLLDKAPRKVRLSEASITSEIAPLKIITNTTS